MKSKKAANMFVIFLSLSIVVIGVLLILGYHILDEKISSLKGDASMYHYLDNIQNHYAIRCKSYEQVEKPMYNLTCQFGDEIMNKVSENKDCGIWVPQGHYEYPIFGGIYSLMNVTPTIGYVNGECIEYGLYPKENKQYALLIDYQASVNESDVS
jgi:hypothetical protein